MDAELISRATHPCQGKAGRGGVSVISVVPMSSRVRQSINAMSGSVLVAMAEPRFGNQRGADDAKYSSEGSRASLIAILSSAAPMAH